MLLRLDSEFTKLLTAANQGEELGDLVIEPVCVKSVTQFDAIAICASDPDPFGGPFPSVGQHIWMEGRYVLDTEHGSWAELHPLYRWGPEGGAAVNTLAPTATRTKAPTSVFTWTPRPTVAQPVATDTSVAVQATATEAALAPTDTQV